MSSGAAASAASCSSQDSPASVIFSRARVASWRAAVDGRLAPWPATGRLPAEGQDGEDPDRADGDQGHGEDRVQLQAGLRGGQPQGAGAEDHAGHTEVTPETPSASASTYAAYGITSATWSLMLRGGCTPASRQPTADSRQPTADSRQPTANNSARDAPASLEVG